MSSFTFPLRKKISGHAKARGKGYRFSQTKDYGTSELIAKYGIKYGKFENLRQLERK